jgi:hypothetical protein
MKIFCKSEPSPGFLYLRLTWENHSSLLCRERIKEINKLEKNRLYITTEQSSFWKDRNGQLYKIHNYGGYNYTLTDSQHRWYNTRINKFLTAEKIDYYELLLEDLFLP